ncbi:MAG TPA: CHAP domain-containing protein [Candidatus Saccharimonadales bacterium]|nr:CHAP domain-containing protein [Candidatus Saccharimonadales bacterium]
MLKQTKLLKRFYSLRTLAATFLLVGLIGSAVAVHADQYDEQINALNAQNGASRKVVNDLAAQAGTYQEAIGVLQAQINGLQAELNANVARQTDLQAQIVAKQAEVDKQKAYLGEDIRMMYIDGQLTTIEELATSKDLSDYVDKESYRTSVQNKIDATIKQIAALQAKLQKQKSELDVLVNSQKQQNEQLANAKYQQDQLLAYNEGQQAAFNQQIKSNNGKIAELRRQQLAANARFIGGPAGSGATCGGGYPAKWCNIPMDSVLDTWGMYNRECVSYTAFRVAASGRYMPGWGWASRGNANQWDDNARAAGIPVDGNPRPGDVAISNSGFYGHAMYVEAVNGNTITVSQYNAALDGRYSVATINKGSLVFIHF